MTAAHTPLVEIVARKLAPGTTGFEYDDLLRYQQAELCARVKPVLDACHAEELRNALLKCVKVLSGETMTKSTLIGALESAANVLTKLDGKP
ncbi:hypothetical protein [Limnoglobus roseus]|uniref:Uncharacterized protein n=1 Tax=Limnoglobus roseus TaxID=2598579 RepID=A0A5C1APH3_9BACT|nr:hypothetical protein [Limnoglobus roseus]QEL18768.1 hypothetical protein PX52LOC_05806 [Limnoglobus roseus]